MEYQLDECLVLREILEVFGFQDSIMFVMVMIYIYIYAYIYIFTFILYIFTCYTWENYSDQTAEVTPKSGLVRESPQKLPLIQV